MSERLPCQVCGRSLTVRRDGLTKPHKTWRGAGEDYCQGTGFRHARWPVGQRLRHHAGSVWEVTGDRGQSGDYVLRCVIGTPDWMGGEAEGKVLYAHGEYMHRHGWTEVCS